MRYPKFLSKNATIGVVAPSAGTRPDDMAVFDSAVKKLTNLGYKLKFASHIFGNSDIAASCDGKSRAIEFSNLYLDPEVDFIMLLCGGELEIEMLPYLDLERLAKEQPKFILGSSDNTNLTYVLTTALNTATLFGYDFMDFGYRNWDLATQQAYEIISAKSNDLFSYDYYIKEKDYLNCLKEIDARHEKWPTSLSGNSEMFEGRIIGGTLDCLATLIGTKYDYTNAFLSENQRDGFIWYLESCDLDLLSQYRALWQLSQAGWLQQCQGILYGRAKNDEEKEGLDTKTMLEKMFGQMNIPVIYNCDIGHVKPSWCIINGAYAIVEYRDSKLRISYIRN